MIFDHYSNFQKKIIADWYEETDQTGSGECNYPLIGLLIGVIGSNPASKLKMVQLGHFNGFSSLMIGFIFQNLGIEKSFFSIDISQKITDQANRWVRKAQLSNHVKQITRSSSDPIAQEKALKYLGTDEINILFIDSSHEYNHTKKELKLWFPKLAVGGMIILHDVSIKSRQSCGVGVRDALKEFCEAHKDELSWIDINGFVGQGTWSKSDLLYQDGCGIGIVQKKPPSRDSV